MGRGVMTTLAVAWRIRRVAVYASIVPMLSMLAFGISGSPLYYVVQFVVHRVVSDNGTYFNPDRVEIAVHGGIALALGAMIGGWLGSHSALKYGARLIRPLLVTVSLALTAKLVWSYFAA